MKTITFNTPASNRTVDRVKRMLIGAYAVSASLGSKRKTVSGFVPEGTNEAYLVARLKSFKCTCIKIQ
jgi:hypothetical protein